MEISESTNDSDINIKNYSRETKKELINRIILLEGENEHLTRSINFLSEQLYRYEKDRCPIYQEPTELYWKDGAHSILMSFIRNGDKDKAKKEANIYSDEIFEEMMRIIHIQVSRF